VINKKKIPVIITFDIDPVKNVNSGIKKTLQLINKLKIPATFFYTANLADELMLKEIKKNNHEIACHALTHDDSEEFDKLNKKECMKIIKKATSILEKKAGHKITSFRSARVKTCSTTLNVLQELGYNVDSSVCSQRLDFISSNLINLGWLIAPRLPYYPSSYSPYKKGNMKILEIPISALILPFISTTLRIFGLTFMKILFNLLYLESRITGKPVVYLVHPYEFLAKKNEIKFTWKFLIPDKTWLIKGLPIRFWLGSRLNGDEFLEINKQLFKWIAKKNVKFFTMKKFRRYYLNQKVSKES
jgi:peptidoglycan-N-acetylglucosamine deacetylase